MLIAAFVLALLALVVVVFIALGVGYCLYQYVWLPWKVVRKDLQALTAQQQAQQEAIDLLRKAEVYGMMSPEELASIERRLLAQSRRRAQEGALRSGRTE